MRAVDGLSFALDEGTLNVLLGPSGCGKSTTLRLIAGLETRRRAAAILIGGRDVTGLPPSQRNIAMVFQSYALFPHLSVAENIVFGLRVRKVSAAEVRTGGSRASPSCSGLSALLERKPSQLSGGQQQRVALGPRDHRRGAGVPDGRAAVESRRAAARRDAQEIRALQRKLGITMVYVTHDQVEAMSMADRVDPAEQRADRAERHAGRALRDAGQHVRRALHRHAADEPAAAGARRDGAVIAGTDGPGGAAGASARAARSACGPSTSRCDVDRGARGDGRERRVPRRRFARRPAASAQRTRRGARAGQRRACAAATRSGSAWAGGAQHYFDATGAARQSARRARRDDVRRRTPAVAQS